MELIRENKIKLASLALIGSIIGIISISKLGVKDGVTLTVGIMLTCIIIGVSKINYKYAIYLFLASMPILVTARKGIYIDLYILKLNLETIIILYLFFSKLKEIIKVNVEMIRSSKMYKRFYIFTFIFVISAYISIMFANNYKLALELTTTSVLVPVIFVALVISIFEKKDIKYICYSLIISLNLSCFYGFAQMVGLGFNLNVIRDSRELITFGYHNVNIFATVALLIVPFTVNEILYVKTTKNEKLFLGLSLLIQILGIFLSFSRGAWLSLGLILVGILFSKKYKNMFIIIVILGVVSAPILLPSILSRGVKDQHFLQVTSNTARVQAITTSYEIVKENPFGVGFGNFNQNYRENVVNGYFAMPEHLREKMEIPLYTLESAHNFFINIGVELGIVAAVAIILIFINRIRSCFKNYGDNRAILISLLIFIFIGLTTGVEINHKGVLTNTYLLWLMFALTLLNNNKNECISKIN